MKPSIRLSGVLVAASFIAAMVGVTPARATSAAVPLAPIPCRPWSYNAESFRLYITGLDTLTADSASRYRSFWNIPMVAPSEIALVRDDSLCDRAARIHAASATKPGVKEYPVFVLKVGGTRYIVFNFMSVGDSFDYTILDSAFKVLGVRRG
jgi:hypothetical protein